MRQSLDSIGLTFGTDKASRYHDYLNFYESFFAPLRDTPLTILEIGVLDGASLKTWEAYFPEATIVGAEINAKAKVFERGRIKIELLDQSDVQELTNVGMKYGPFDIVVEDGSHMLEHQITSLRTLFPFVKPDGIYIVEDLQTNYGGLRAKYQGIASQSCVDFLKTWLDLRVADDQLPLKNVEDAFLRTYGRSIRFMTFYRRACLIKKDYKYAEREGTKASPLMVLETENPPIPMRIQAHLSHVGDVAGTEGFIHSTSKRNTLQGFLIEAPHSALDYRVRFADLTWSDWTPSGEFAGTRGKSRIIHGFTVRLAEHAGPNYSLRYAGLFADTDAPVLARSNEDCVSPTGGPLIGIQIFLIELV